MPRANRYYTPGYCWHVTHRCHDQKFLLKFDIDKRRWCHWMYEARKLYPIRILNYTITSNHIHLLIYSSTKDNVIAKALHLAAGRTAWEFNQRKNRKGSYWEDRYHATAVETGEHLMRCMVYIDLNMVRAGVVRHPREWPFGGYQEIMGNKQRYRLIDTVVLTGTMDIPRMDFEIEYNTLLNECLESKPVRDPKWTTCLALGSREFVERYKTRMGLRGEKLKIAGEDRCFRIREETAAYRRFSGPKIGSKPKKPL